MDSQQQLDENAINVLTVLRERSMDGYALLSKTKLDRKALETTLRQLVGRALVRVTGDYTEERLGESFFSVPSEVVGFVDQVLGRPTRYYR